MNYRSFYEKIGVCYHVYTYKRLCPCTPLIMISKKVKLLKEAKQIVKDENLLLKVRYISFKKLHNKKHKSC